MPETSTRTLDKTYDGIIFGVRHHGLILGSYLAKAWLDILLVERRLTYGTPLCRGTLSAPRCFLASEPSSFVTGQSLNLDGGVTGSSCLDGRRVLHAAHLAKRNQLFVAFVP